MQPMLYLWNSLQSFGSFLNLHGTILRHILEKSLDSSSKYLSITSQHIYQLCIEELRIIRLNTSSFCMFVSVVISVMCLFVVCLLACLFLICLFSPSWFYFWSFHISVICKIQAILLLLVMIFVGNLMQTILWIKRNSFVFNIRHILWFNASITALYHHHYVFRMLVVEEHSAIKHIEDKCMMRVHDMHRIVCIKHYFEAGIYNQTQWIQYYDYCYNGRNNTQLMDYYHQDICTVSTPRFKRMKDTICSTPLTEQLLLLRAQTLEVCYAEQESWGLDRKSLEFSRFQIFEHMNVSYFTHWCGMDVANPKVSDICQIIVTIGNTVYFARYYTFWSDFVYGIAAMGVAHLMTQQYVLCLPILKRIVNKFKIEKTLNLHMPAELTNIILNYVFDR
eukprot:235631_1